MLISAGVPDRAFSPQLTFWLLSLRAGISILWDKQKGLLLKMVHLLTVPKDLMFLFLGCFALCVSELGAAYPQTRGLGECFEIEMLGSGMGVGT